MLPQIENIQTTTGITTEVKKQEKLGRDDFLKIFLTQLQYQDPLNPMEGTEFTAQLAQFSSLEQLFNINDQLKGLEKIQGKESKFQALNLIDKLIRAEGDKLFLSNGAEAQGAFTLKGEAECSVLVEDVSGNAIRTIPLGILPPGSHQFKWDGRNEEGVKLSDGIYRFKVIAKDRSGNAVPADCMIQGKVTGVSIRDEMPVIKVGDIELSLDQVVEVQVNKVGNGQSADMTEDGSPEI